MQSGHYAGMLTKDGMRCRAVVLEMIGDLPEADAKPPENMLFVCKLNQARMPLVLGTLTKSSSFTPGLTLS